MSHHFLDARTIPRMFAVVALAIGISATSAASLITDLVIYSKFDGNGNDSSGNGRDLSLFGGVGFATGLFGQALDLHADVTQYAQRPVNDTSLNFGSGDFTIQTWFNFNSASREQTLIEKFSGQSGPAWTLTTFPDALRFASEVFPNGNLNANVSIEIGTWHDVMVRRSGNAFDLFFDGANVATGSSSLPIGSTIRPLLIGKRNEGDVRDFSVDGRIDEVAIWTRALSDSEITTLYNSGQGFELPITIVPEPSCSLVLLAGAGLMAVFDHRRRK